MRFTLPLAIGLLLVLAGCQDDKKSSLVGNAAEGDAPAPKSTATLGQAAPNPMGNVKTTKQHIVDQHCLANCASIERNCLPTADGADGKKRCIDEKTKCDSSCQ